MRRRVVLGFLGTTLDAGRGEERWQRWRPTVALCQQPGLFVDRVELLVDRRWDDLAKRITADVGTVSPATEVRHHRMDLKDAWDFSEVYSALRAFANGYDFDPEREDYLVNITTGTHVAQICWFLLTEARYVPGRLLQISPPKRRRATRASPGRIRSSISTSRATTRSRRVSRRSGRRRRPI